MNNCETSLLKIFKSLNKYSQKWDNYFSIYEDHLGKFVNKSPTILEIGVAQGGSLEMWSKYFKNGTIHGVDLWQGCEEYKYDDPNVHITIGDQNDQSFWNSFVADKPFFDAVIDDGSHLFEHQINSLLALFPYVKDGGVYIVEDIHTSYSENYGGGFRKQGTFVEFAKMLVDFQNRQFMTAAPPPELTNSFRNLESITFYNSMVVFKKSPTPFINPIHSNELYARKEA